jgi:hypothetical protein
LTNWTAAATNSFDSNGCFSLTNSLNPSVRQQFYALETPPSLRTANPDLWIPACGAWLGAFPAGGSEAGYGNLESQIGRKLDIYRTYNVNLTALPAEALYYITNGNKFMTSRRPGSLWSDVSGRNPTINSQLASLAQSVASVKPNKVMLSLWPEPEQYIIPHGTNGTAADYVAMWQNVWNIFTGNGATNVIWCWDVEGNPGDYYEYTNLWPGNSYVDWVGWDGYQGSATEDYVATQTSRYNWFLTNSTSLCNWAGKPWAWFEWGIGVNSYYPTAAQETNGINAISTAINNNQFPGVVFMDYFDSGPSTFLSETMASFSNYANSPYMKQQCSH